MLEVVVIGSGIAGFASALALWERGAAVTVVEESRPGAGATGASAGMLVAQYEASPGDMFRLDLESRRRYPEFAARVSRSPSVTSPFIFRRQSLSAITHP